MAEPDTETALIKRAQSGDKGAFEALLRRYYDVMYRTAYKWCGNKADAEDITQTACIKLAHSIDGFRHEASFRSWLYRLVINTSKDWVRSRARYAPEAEAEADRSEAPGAEMSVYARQVMDYVRSMPEREQIALLLVFSEGLSHREASLVMQCKESTVSWYIHEARKKLQSFRELEHRHG